jgi:hypothetical protein
MRKTFLILLLTLSSIMTKAEITKELTKVYSEINGEAIFELYENVEFDCAKSNKGFHLIGLEIFCKEKEVFDKWSVPENYELKLDNGIVIGKTLKPISPESLSERENGYSVEILGYIKTESILTSSIVENALQNIFSSEKEIVLESLIPHLERFGYRPFRPLGNFGCIINYESWAEDPSPGPRIILLFQETILVGVINSRQLEIKNVEQFEVDNFICQFIKQIDSSEIELFKNQFTELLKYAD